MPTFQHEGSGQTIEIPDEFTPAQRDQAFQQFIASQQSGVETKRSATSEQFETKRAMRIGSMEAQLGAPLARAGTGAGLEMTGPGGAALAGGPLAEAATPAGARFDVAKSLSPEGTMKKLQDKFPNLEIRLVDDLTGGQLVAIREPGKEPFALLDSDELFTLGDLAEIGGDLTSMETVGTIISAIKSRGAMLLGRVLSMAGGAAAGRASDIAIEQARGFEKLALDEHAADVALSGALAATGELLFTPFRRFAQVATRRGIATLTPEEQLAQKTAEDVGIKSLTLGAVVPLAKRIEQQAAGTSKAVQQSRLDTLTAVLDDLKRLRGGAKEFTGLDDAQLDKVIKAHEDAMFKMLGIGPVDPAKGGKALITGRKEFVKVYKARLDRLYTQAVAAYEDLSLDVTKGVNLAKGFKKGIRSADPSGKGVRVTIDPKGELAQIIDALSKIDPNVKAFENLSAFEQIKAMRTDLFDLKNAALPGQERIDNRIAGQLYSALSEAMDNPLGAGSEQARRLYRRASLSNRRKEAILDVADMRIIAQTSNLDADGLVKRIAQPYNGSTLRLLARVMPPKQFAAFRETFKSDLISKPEGIVARLDQFRADPRALRVLLSPDEEAAFRILGQRWTRFQSSAFKKAMSEISDVQKRASMIIRKADSTEIDEFVRRAGGKTSPQGRALRAGVYQTLIENAERTVKGRAVVDVEAMIGSIKSLDQSGKLRAVFTPDEVATLLNRRDLVSFLDVTADPGASIQAAEIGANLAAAAEIPFRPVASTRRFLKGLTAAFRNALVGRFFTSPMSRRLLVGSGKSRLDLTALRALAAVTAEMANDIQEDLKGLKSHRASEP